MDKKLHNLIFNYCLFIYRIDNDIFDYIWFRNPFVQGFWNTIRTFCRSLQQNYIRIGKYGRNVDWRGFKSALKLQWQENKNFRKCIKYLGQNFRPITFFEIDMCNLFFQWVHFLAQPSPVFCCPRFFLSVLSCPLSLFVGQGQLANLSLPKMHLSCLCPLSLISRQDRTRTETETG